MHSNGVSRTRINRSGIHQASSHGRTIRRRRRWCGSRFVSAVDKLRASAEIVLAGIAAQPRPGEIGHVIIEPGHAPGKTLTEHHVYATAGRYAKAALGTHADY